MEIATARSFILNRGIVTDTMSARPLESGWCAVHSPPPSFKHFNFQASQVLKYKTKPLLIMRACVLFLVHAGDSSCFEF